MATLDGDPARAPRVVVDVSGYGRPDLVLVNVLTRVRLVTGRLGIGLEVRGGDRALAQLLELVGLLAVVPIDAVAVSQARGEPEALEEPGVEEVVDVRDASVTQLEHLDRPRLVPPAGPAGPVLGEGG
jgi:hypothetical protein